mgnify:CR=1 FL=1
MRLLLDAGNTRLKWGLRTGNAWLDQGVVEYAGLEALAAVLPRDAPALPVFGVNVAGPAVADAVHQVLQRPHAARRNDRDRHRICDRTRQLGIEPGFSAVAIHRR